MTKTTGFVVTARKLRALKTTMSAACGKIIREAGDDILADVQNTQTSRGVPFKTGRLSQSGRVRGPTGKIEPAVTVSFGNARVPYALRQHENLDYHHPVGEARYLVRGMRRHPRENKEKSRASFEKHLQRALNRAKRA